MKTLKKGVRTFVIICLIILAGMGLGLSGGVPVPNNNRRNDKTEFKNELEAKEQDENVIGQQ
jgi:hypothetical protein